MPTYERLPRFDRDYAALTTAQRAKFKAAVRKFIEDMERGEGFRAGLRVKGVEGASSIFELTWDGDGRATFAYGSSIRNAEPHVIWRRIGTHGIFRMP